MPIEYQKSDLFTCEVDAIAHGCNCMGVMGAGVALQFQKRFPEMYLEYRNKCLAGEFKPGSCFVWTQGTKTIYNLGTQVYPGKFARTSYIKEAMLAMLNSNKNIKTIAIPRIGCGLGGLSWEKDVKQTMNKIMELFPTKTLIVCEW